MLARLARIYPLHVFILILFVGLECTQWVHFQFTNVDQLMDIEKSHPPFTEKQSVWSIFTNLAMVQALHSWSYWNEPAWSIGAEWFIYMFVPFLIPIANRTNKVADMVGTLSAYLILFVMVERYDNLDFITWRSLVRCFCECTIGIVIYKVYRNGFLFGLFSNSWMPAVLLILSYVLLYLPTNHVVLIFVFSLLILSSASGKETGFLSHPILKFLGTISYSIYMTHWLVQEILRESSRWLTHSEFHQHFTFDQMLILLPFLIGGVILVSSLTYRFVERPFRDRIRNVQLLRIPDKKALG